MEKIAVLIPCYNEELTIEKVVKDFRRELPEAEIYVYDNLTSEQINEHFLYWSLLYQKGIVHQITFNTKESTFNAFSKATSSNCFGFNHEQDPNKDNVDFLVFLDNDIIIAQQGWDKIIKNAWADIKKYNMTNIKIIGQLPGGIKSKKEISEKIGGFRAKSGLFGGSGFWTVKNNFFRDIGYLNVKDLVGHNKKHDQLYWGKLGSVTNGHDYILGLDVKLVIHTGSMAGSVCNTLTRNKGLKQRNVEELIKFEEAEKAIDSLSFDDFFKIIVNNKEMIDNW
jgi:cellulose synthase/poly-beta-1,6-N-acetylglucosamine synthase-like glycosyltransferase